MEAQGELMKYYGVFVLVCVFLTGCADKPTLDLYGTVLDGVTGRPVENASVSDGTYAPELGASDYTDEQGSFSYFTYPEEHTVIISKQGYLDKKLTIGLKTGAKKEELLVTLFPDQ
jgi:hypothetical protein